MTKECYVLSLEERKGVIEEKALCQSHSVACTLTNPTGGMSHK